MYLYILMSNVLAGYYIFFENIFNKVFTKKEIENDKYQSMVFMNFESKQENNNPYYYDIQKIEYKYIECIKDNKLFDKSTSMDITSSNFYDQLFGIFHEHLISRHEIFKNPIYIFVKSENDKMFLIHHLSYLQLYDDYIHINSLENISKFLIELKSYKFKDLIYHFSINKNEKQEEIMNNLYDKLMELLSKNVVINNKTNNKYFNEIKLDINDDVYCTKRKLLYTDFEKSIEEDNENNSIESIDSMEYLGDDKNEDVNNSSYLNEYILKQLKTNPYYINDYIINYNQLEIIF